MINNNVEKKLETEKNFTIHISMESLVVIGMERTLCVVFSNAS